MALLASWPSITDDTTVYNKSFFDAVKASVEDNVHSTTNPTIQVKDTIDEVVEARGNTASLSARLAGVLNADGSLITPSSVLSQAQLANAEGKNNWLKNGDFSIWQDSDTTIPVPWFLGYGTLAVQQCGNGLSDTKRKTGPYCLRVLNTGSSGLSQYLFDTTDDKYCFDWLKGKKVSAGAWVWASEVGHVKLVLNDGAASSAVEHTGGASWEWITLTHTLDSSATMLYLQFQFFKNSNVYIDSVWAGRADYAPSRYQLQDWENGTRCTYYAGVPVIEDYNRYITFPYMAQLTGISALCRNNPTGGPFTVGIQRYTPWADVFDTTNIDLVADGTSYGAYYDFDDTHASRGLRGMMEAGAWSDSLVKIKIVAVNSCSSVFLNLHYRCPRTYIENTRRVDNH
jgi:hypothetical protein